VDFALVAFGLGVGILVGMTGIGGGSLMTPMIALLVVTMVRSRRAKAEVGA
jgi:uncharacterized membrane protein YfcA